ncbi:MAG: amidohydrolase [Desulfobacteraceae bacterium]|nr:amidohydrolase [Desulfobacteraceae bacterium]
MTVLIEKHPIRDWLIKVRRDLHKHPELGHEETRTTGKVKAILMELGIEIREMNGLETGAVGLLGSGNGPVIGLRADMDALPITQLNDVPYKSTVPGVMHACGHDCHTAIMLGVAKSLVETGLAKKLKGRVKFIFQPAEEKMTGARAMIDAGVLEKPSMDRIIAGHMFIDLPVGQVGFFKRVSHASADTFHLTIHGKSIHGARPHMGIDPIIAGSQFLNSIQTIISRNTDPADQAVISVGSFNAGTAPNIIPDSATLSGTVRTFDENVRKRIVERLSDITLGLEKSMGVKVDFRYIDGVPVAPVDDIVTTDVKRAAESVLGADNVHYLDTKMGAEDFSFFSRTIPATFMRVGCGNPDKGIVHLPHSSRFDVDEDALVVGVDVLVETVKRFLVDGTSG